jgi:hypothetical protein
MKMHTELGRPQLWGRVLAMALGTSIVIAAPMTLSPRMAAQEEETGRVCAEHTLRGDYGLQATGVRTLPPVLGGGSEHFVATALWTFHGDGTFTQGTGAALKGEITGIAGGSIGSEGELPGTYQVNANCTGSMALYPPELPFPIQYSFVIVNNARQVKVAIISPGTGTAELVRK